MTVYPALLHLIVTQFPHLCLPEPGEVPPKKRLPSFKLRGSSLLGGQLLDNYILPHLPSEQSICTCTHNINTSFHATILVNSHPVQCLIDSGATISLIKYNVVHNNDLRGAMCQSSVLATGANGSPLQVTGQIELPVKCGYFEVRCSKAAYCGLYWIALTNHCSCVLFQVSVLSPYVVLNNQD